MKQKKKYLSCLIFGLGLGISIPFLFSSPVYCQPRPLVVLSDSELNDQALYDTWVEFADKGLRNRRQRELAIKKLEKSFSRRALERRKKRRTFLGLFDERDFPIAAKYLKRVAKTGAQIRVQSRWLNGVTVLVSKEQILKIKKLKCVKEVGDYHEHRPRMKKEPDTESRPQRQEQESVSGFYGRSEIQIRQLGLDRLHEAGFTGDGVIIAVVDAGFNLAHKALRHPDKSINVIAQWDFVENDGNVVPDPDLDPTHYSHGTSVFGAIASYAPEELVGTAYDADFILCNAEDGETEYYLEERWYVAALEFAESHGADVLSSSLVLYGGHTQEQTDGQTAVMTRGLNIAVGNGVICLAGCGNNGHDGDPGVSHLMVPADAPDVISVGAINSDRSIARFSSDGPGGGGRLKPEVLAMGSRAASISATDSETFSRASGTSIATPIMAGAVACLLQVHPDWTVQEIRGALFESGDYFRQHGKPDPLFIQGFGIPDVFLAADLKQ
jgi:serine protease AprX